MLVEKGTEIDSNFYTIGEIRDSHLKKNNRKSMDDLPIVTNHSKQRLRTMSSTNLKTPLPKRFTMGPSVDRIQTLNTFNFNNKSSIDFDPPHKLKNITKKYKNLNSDNLKRLVGGLDELTGNLNMEPNNYTINKKNFEGKSSYSPIQREELRGVSTGISSNDSAIKKISNFFPKVSQMSTFSSQNKKSVLGIDQSLTPTPKISGFRMSTKILNRKETIWNDILNEYTVKKIIEPRKKSGEDEDMLPKQRMLELKRTILKEKDKMKDVIDSLKRQQIMSKDKLKTFISNLHMQKVKGLK
jgi:hypothetical protein